MNACFGDSGCAKAVDCISECPPNDMSCIDGCEQQSVGAAAKLSALRMCQHDQCSAKCM